MSQEINAYVERLARDAKAASRPLAAACDAQRSATVRAMAIALRDRADLILAANAEDMADARAAGTADGLLDRLLLTPERIEGMAVGLERLACLPDPVGRVLEHRTIDCGLDLTRVSVPLGLVAMVYEARPNVTADAAAICIRTGNACILRGGSLAQRSCVAIARAAGLGEGTAFVPATEEDWGREYLALEISVKTVSGLPEAVEHINRYGTMHSEAIVAQDEEACERFLAEVDASCVYANASTRFTDGGEFGLGAEIGISTQKLHARGPFAAEALTTYKYEIRGTGQVRP